MPRLAPSLLRRAASESVLLARLLRECRDLTSARNELRWLTEYAWNNNTSSTSISNHHHRSRTPTQRLARFIHRRSKGEPLQYILGTQPFGDLEILCRKHVLIPRPETELYTIRIGQLLNKARRDGALSAQRELRIADLCTGTACIPLLLHSILRPPAPATFSLGPHVEQGREHDALTILGLDLSNHALTLARENLQHNLEQGSLRDTARDEVALQRVDVLELGRNASEPASHRATCSLASTFLRQKWSVIISNPPYISPTDYAPGGTTTRSVRNYEPKLALVPPPLPASSSSPVPATTSALKHGGGCVQQADQFYDAVLKVAKIVDTELLVMEIGDSAQARRVRALAMNRFGSDYGDADVDRPVVETWRDDGSVRVCHRTTHTQPDHDCDRIDDGDLEMAPERAIVVWRGQLARWRDQTGNV